MVRLRRWMVSMVLLAGLTGCGAASLISQITSLTGGNTTNTVTAAASLTAAWTVQAYSGTSAGSVTVPAAAQMVWNFKADGTFTLISTKAVTLGTGTHVYDEAGTWLVTDATGGQMTLTMTRKSGAEIAITSQTVTTASYTLDSGQLTLSTSAIGPGTVRYAMGH